MPRITQVFESIDQSKNNHEFLKTGFESLDEILDGGFLRKELIIIGAATGQGKSYIAGQLFANISRQGFKSAYISLEISNEMIAARLAGAIANIKPTRIQTGLLTGEELDAFYKAKADLEVYEEYMEFVDNAYDLSEIKKVVMTGGYEFVVIDFIQNVVAKGESENARLTLVALELQRLAKEANCCILALSQLSNAATREGDKVAVVEYRGSGSIAMVADLGFFLNRMEQPEGLNVQTVKLTLKKNRRGSSGWEIQLNFKVPGGYLYEA